LGNAWIRLTRAPAGWRDMARAYVVTIDGRRAGSIRRGQTIDFNVLPGVHGLQLSIDWVGSRMIPFRLDDGQIAEFQCRPGGAFWQLWQIFDVEGYVQLLPVSGVTPA
jgi:hypothetical protein